MTNIEMRKILKGKKIYFTNTETNNASKFKFYITYKNELLNITHELAMQAGFKLTNDREIRVIAGGTNRVVEVLYGAWKNVKGKKDESVIAFRYEGL